MLGHYSVLTHSTEEHILPVHQHYFPLHPDFVLEDSYSRLDNNGTTARDLLGRNQIMYSNVFEGCQLIIDTKVIDSKMERKKKLVYSEK